MFQEEKKAISSDTSLLSPSYSPFVMNFWHGPKVRGRENGAPKSMYGCETISGACTVQ